MGPALQGVLHQAAHGRTVGHLGQHIQVRLGRVLVQWVALQQGGEQGFLRWGQVVSGALCQGVNQFMQVGHLVQVVQGVVAGHRRRRSVVGRRHIDPHRLQASLDAGLQGQGLVVFAVHGGQPAVGQQLRGDMHVQQVGPLQAHQRPAPGMALGQQVAQQPQRTQRQGRAGRGAVQCAQHTTHRGNVPGQRKVLRLGVVELATQKGGHVVQCPQEAAAAGRERRRRRGRHAQVGPGLAHLEQRDLSQLASGAGAAVGQQQGGQAAMLGDGPAC